MNLTIQPKLTHSVPFKAQMDESAYRKIIKANPQFKLPDGVQVVNDDTFVKSKQTPQKTETISKAKEDTKKDLEDENKFLNDSYPPEYDDPNWHGFTEYDTIPTGKIH